MKVDLERVEGTPERYKVKVREDDSSAGVPSGTVIGMATRTGETTWGFGPRQGDDNTFDTSMSLALTAKDPEELKAAIQSRFGLLTDIPPDRLLDDTLEGFASSMLTPISVLATNTASMGGLIKALAHHVAVIAASDVQDDKREEFFTMFMDRAREETDVLVRQRATRAALASRLGEILKSQGRTLSEVLNGLQGGNDDGPVKH